MMMFTMLMLTVFLFFVILVVTWPSGGAVRPTDPRPTWSQRTTTRTTKRPVAAQIPRQPKSRSKSRSPRPQVVCLGCDDLMDRRPTNFFCLHCWVVLPTAVRNRIAEAWRTDRVGETHNAMAKALDDARAVIQERLTRATQPAEGEAE